MIARLGGLTGPSQHIITDLTKPMLETPIQERLDRISELTATGCMMGIRIRFGRPTLLLSTYCDSWTRLYQESNAYLADPAIAWGISHTGAMRWSQLRLPDPFDVMKKASDFGLNYGVTVSVGKFYAKSIAGMAHSEREFTDDEIATFTQMISEIHDIVSERKPLLETHLRALELFSYGYSYEDMCDRLNISRTALKSRLAGARKRLGAGSNVEAVRLASERNLLRPHPLTGKSS